MQKYGPYIYKTVYAVLHSPHDAEDVTQEVLLQIYRSLPDCRLDGLKTWITRVAINRAIDWRRSRARRPEQLANSSSAETGIQGEPIIHWQQRAPAAEEQVIERSRKNQLQEQLQQLPDNYRDVVRAFYVEDKSYEEIATETGLEKKGVETRLYRARNWMRRHWRREDFE